MRRRPQRGFSPADGRVRMSHLFQEPRPERRQFVNEAEGRRLRAEANPSPCAGDSKRIGRSWNSSSRSLGAAAELGSPNCCQETSAPHPAPTGRGSFPRSPACSTCPVRRPSSGRDRTRDGARHDVSSPIVLAPSNRMVHLRPLISAILEALPALEAGQLRRIGG